MKVGGYDFYFVMHTMLIVQSWLYSSSVPAIFSPLFFLSIGYLHKEATWH